MRRRKTLGSAAPKNVDRHGANELRLYLDNEERLYRQKQAIEVTVTKHVCRGQFSATKAAKAFQYVVDEAARSYAREFGAPMKQDGSVRDKTPFSKSTRTSVARDLAAEYTRAMRACVRGKKYCDLSSSAAQLLAKSSCKRR
jgi:hypothetical protein